MSVRLALSLRFLRSRCRQARLPLPKAAAKTVSSGWRQTRSRGRRRQRAASAHPAYMAFRPWSSKGIRRKPRLYTLLLRAGPNIRALPHSHQDDRVATVISDMWYIGYGETFDEAGLKELPPGSFYTEPRGSNHFAMTKDEPVVIQITGMGPTSTTYVNPDDDPSR